MDIKTRYRLPYGAMRTAAVLGILAIALGLGGCGSTASEDAGNEKPLHSWDWTDKSCPDFRMWICRMPSRRPSICA